MLDGSAARTRPRQSVAVIRPPDWALRACPYTPALKAGGIHNTMNQFAA